MMLPSLALVGTGSVSRAVGRAHVDAGGAIVCVRSRSEERASQLAMRLGSVPATRDGDLGGADVILVAVSDRAVADVGVRLREVLASSHAVALHTSGSLPGAALDTGGGAVGSLHPLQSFPSPCAGDEAADPGGYDRRLARLVAGAHWFHEGAGAERAAALVAAWGGDFHALAPGAKVLYHAAAAIVSNHTVALFDAATQLFAAAGISSGDAREPLVALLSGTVANLRDKGAPAALTGPIARGDVRTVERHVAALRVAAPHLVASYVEMARLAVDAAVRRGSLDAPTAARFGRVLHA